MKSLLALLAIALLGQSAAACGGTSKATGSASQASSRIAATGAKAATASSATSTQNYAKADRDKDNDVEAPYDDTNNNEELNYGRAASSVDKQAIAALIKRYYAAAAAGDGAKACSMLYVTFAEAVPEDYGTSPPGQPYMRGKTCPAVMALLFKHDHSQLIAELPLLEVRRVRLEQHHGLAVLSFGTMPERQIPVQRERRTWKIEALLDSALS
jgi:hypothetical protein